MSIQIPPPGKLSAQHWILAALLGTLAAVAVVAVVSISLAPGHISFSVADARIVPSGGADMENQYYSFTVEANNTSGPTAARYVALSAEIWYSLTGWVPVDVNTSALPFRWQPPRMTASIPFSAEYWQYDVVAPAAAAPSNTSSKAGTTAGKSNVAVDERSGYRYRVVVIAKVVFRFWLAQTRPFVVRASCPVVYFPISNSTRSSSTAAVGCTAG